MHVDLWTLALQTINVLILVWLLARFLFRPVREAIAARQQAADRLLAEAQAAREQAAAEAAALDMRNAAFKADAEKRHAEMLSRVAAERQELLARAAADAAASAARAEAAAAVANTRLRIELEQQAVVLAGSMAGTLLSRLPPSRTTDAMFELLVDSLRNLSDEARRQLAGEPLCVVTPAAVDPAARDRYGQALMQALPGLRAPDFTVDATLIAGFELRGGNLQVRNSWRADLDRMLARLREGHHDERGR